MISDSELIGKTICFFFHTSLVDNFYNHGHPKNLPTAHYSIVICDFGPHKKSDLTWLLYLHGLVTISKVVDDGQRLLEAGTASQRHIGN